MAEHRPPHLEFDLAGTGRTVRLRDFTTVVAGYTGRDPYEVRRHIKELEAIGVAPPDSVPVFIPVDSALVTQDNVITVQGRQTSGEVEPVLLRCDGHLYLGVGSDHTDRDLERSSLSASKRACPKPVATTVVPLPAPDRPAAWDAIGVASHVDGVLYQQGRLSALRDFHDLLRAYRQTTAPHDGDLVMFGGTVALLTGQLVCGTRWSVQLRTPHAGTIHHDYRVVPT